MSALYAFANFAFASLIVIAQIMYHNHILIIYRQELKDVALGELRPLLRQISDIRRFTAMTSEGKLVFAPFPENPLEWVPWFENNLQIAQETTLRVKIPKKADETISFLTIYLMGYGWNQKVNIWSAEDADIQRLNAAEIIKHAQSLLEEEKKYLKEDEALSHFSDVCLH